MNYIIVEGDRKGSKLYAHNNFFYLYKSTTLKHINVCCRFCKPEAGSCKFVHNHPMALVETFLEFRIYFWTKLLDIWKYGCLGPWSKNCEISKKCIFQNNHLYMRISKRYKPLLPETQGRKAISRSDWLRRQSDMNPYQPYQ